MSAPDTRDPSSPKPSSEETQRLPAGDPVDPRSTVQVDIPKLLRAQETLKLSRVDLGTDPNQTQRLMRQKGEEPPIRVQKVDLPLETEGQTQPQITQPGPGRSFGWKLPLALAVLVTLVSLAYFVSAGWLRTSAGAPSVRAGTLGTVESGASATEVYLQQAKAGDAHAMRMLGVMYYYGLNVPQDREKGLQWYRKAAEKGSDAARLELAKIEGGR